MVARVKEPGHQPGSNNTQEFWVEGQGGGERQVTGSCQAHLPGLLCTKGTLGIRNPAVTINDTLTAMPETTTDLSTHYMPGSVLGILIFRPVQTSQNLKDPLK